MQTTLLSTTDSIQDVEEHVVTDIIARKNTDDGTKWKVHWSGN